MCTDALKGLVGDTLPRSASDVLRDAEMDEMDKEVLQGAPPRFPASSSRFSPPHRRLAFSAIRIVLDDALTPLNSSTSPLLEWFAFVRVVALQQRVQHYRDLGRFVVLMALFITILYLQADSSRSYEITSAHAMLYPPPRRLVHNRRQQPGAKWTRLPASTGNGNFVMQKSKPTQTIAREGQISEMSSLPALIRLGRLKFIPYSFILALLGALSRDIDHQPHNHDELQFHVESFLPVALFVACTHVMTHYFNEYFDYEADLANKQRGKWNGGSGVLPEGLLPPWVALAAGNVFLIGSIVTLAFLRTPAQYVACATVFLSWGYTGPPFKLHYRGLGEVVVAIVLTWCVPVMGALQRRGDGAFLLPTSLRTIIPLLFVQQFVRMMVMNLPDIESDLQCGKITLTAQMGPSGRHDSSNTFDGLDDFYNWLNTSIIQVRSLTSPLNLCVIAPCALGACFVPHTHAYLPPTHAASQPSLLCIKARTLIGSCAPHCPPLSPPPLQKLWVDPTCGSGTCDRPFQYPAFGRFGCEADCGIFPSLTSIVIRLSSQLDTQQAADESSWNLCMVNPVSLCWYARPPPAALIFLLSPSCVLIPPYATPCMSAMRCGAIRYEEFQPFRVGDTEVSVALDIPDGDWVVVLNAPAGGIRGTVHAPPPGMRRFSVVGAASTIELAAWGYCTHDDDVDAANQALPSGGAGGSPPDVCRDTCARLVLCLPATCGRAFTEREVAGTFVDCARMCIVAPSSITTYADTPCPMAQEQLRHLHPRRRLYPHRYSDWTSSALPTDAPPAFVSLAASAVSADAAPVALLALPVQGAPGAAVAALPPPAAARAVAAAAAAVAAMAAAGTAATADPTQPSLWSLLGATDRQRLTALQVAVSRALFTMAKDRCLAGRAPGAEARVAAGASNHTHGGLGSVRWRMVTCFCTMLGGPVTTLDECRFMDEAGQLVVEGGEMYAYLQRTHVSGGRMISAQHMRRFMQTMVAALRSVTPMPDAAAARLNTLMHSFNDAIVTSDSVGCAQGGAWLQWRAGVSHNTTIHVGDKVTWVWDDDLPHLCLQISITSHSRHYLVCTSVPILLLAGMGEAGDPLFVGFGGNRLAVSRQIACTPMNVGAGVMRDDPVPCVLRMDDEPLGSFAYSKVFGEPITIHYTDGSLAGTAGDAVSSSASPSSSPTPTSMSASILTVLPARAGADATGKHCMCAFHFSCAFQLFHALSHAPSPMRPLPCALSHAPSPMRPLPCALSHARSPMRPLPWALPFSCIHSPSVHYLLNVPSFVSNTAVVTNTTNPTAANSTTAGPTNTTATYECAPGCRLQRLANGVCDSPCNTPACAFDGGDYACVDPLFGPGICACPPGHTRRDDGCQSPVSPLHSTLSPPALLHRASLLSCSHFTLALPSYSLFLISLPFLVSVPPLSPPACCLSTAVGANLNFPFSLQRYGPNYTERNYVFAAERGFAATRYVSRRNRLLIGMVLQQDRWGTQQCSRAGNGTSTEPFGVNPHFLPTSAIYDSAASANMSQLDNNTFGFKLKFNPQGLPYGFIYPMESLTTYPLVFGINLENEAATRRLHYLVDGSYIDNGTRSIDVNFITFNGETLTFVLTTVRCTMNEGGSMAVTFKSQPAAMAMYDASAENIARLVLEIIYLVGLLWNVVVLWRYVSTFDMQPRYNIYYSLFEAPRYWAVPNPPTGFIRATQVFADLRNIINLRAVYFALQGINVFFMMIRLLKVMDFQPYLGVITRSLGLATPSLMHFFLLSFTVFFCFSMYGYLVFGGTMELENPRKRRFKSIQRRVTAMLSGTRGSAADKATPFPRSDNQPTFPSAASESRVWKQHVLTVRDKRIDVISLAMILQRHHDHAAKKAPATSSSGACLVSWNAEEDRLEQLSQAVVLQCGEVVKQAALPVKKPVQKLSLAHVQVRGEGEGCMWRCARTRVRRDMYGCKRGRREGSATRHGSVCRVVTSQWLPSLTHASRPVPPVCRAWSEQEEVVRCQAGVEELRGMMADMQSDMRAMMALLDRALPASRAHTPRVSRS
ncbi:unnamed protein product [Closterium sp. NIES-65]|nr:unnamed protein product [Closterium sp. NIES-65]